MTKQQTDFCAQPKQCPLQHHCGRNMDNWRAPVPQGARYRIYVSPPDGECPGFVDTGKG